MHRVASMFFIAVLAAILQLTAVTYAGIGPLTFNLELIVLVFFSLRCGIGPGIKLGLFFGIFNGLFGISPFWLNVFLYASVGSIVGYLGRWFYRESLPAFLLMIFCSLGFIYFFTAPQSGIFTHFFRLFPLSAAYNIAVSAFLFYFLRKLGT